MKVGDCKHFRSPAIKDACFAGVNFRELVGGPELGWRLRLPCRVDHRTDVRCESYEPVTAEDVAAREREIEAVIERAKIVDPEVGRIKKAYKGRTASGEIPCPVCKTGTIAWAHVGFNGHVRMHCSTRGCVAFVE